MNETTVGIVLILLFFLAAGVGIIQDNRNRRKRFLARIIASWGKFPDREYTWEELEHISRRFYQTKKEGFQIDDITWNDLDMDRIFAEINQSVSPLGDEYLYAMLRTPCFQEEELCERQRLLEFFRDQEETRHKIQELLSHIRKPPNTSMYEAVHVTKDVAVKGSGVQILQCAAFFLSILIFALNPSIGVFFFLGIMVLNIGTYLVQKSDIEMYLSSFSCVMQLLGAQKALEKLKIPQLAEYTAKGSQYKKALGSFRRGAAIVVERTPAGGGLDGLLLDYIRMITHIDLIKFYDMVKCMQNNIREIEGLMELFGFLDAMISAASYREALPYYCLPVFTKKEQADMEVHDLFHPLIEAPVANSITARGSILVTGSNASGKSTFLKNIAVNSILAQTLYTCTANSYEAPFYKVMTSMALRDDLESGESYYIVEIRSLKRILEEAAGEGKILCIIDEVLRGTNTIERIGASSRILAKLSAKNVLPFAATHDIELSYILEDLYENYHFEEEVREHDVVFNYLLKKGRVTTRNAIRLLEMIGYDKEIIQSAKEAVREFEAQGIWRKIEDREKLSGK